MLEIDNRWAIECGVCHGAIPHAKTRVAATLFREFHVRQTGHDWNEIIILPVREWQEIYPPQKGEGGQERTASQA